MTQPVESPIVHEPAISEAEADERFRRDHFDLAALGAKADHRYRAGDHRAAASFYALAMRTAQGRGAADQAAVARHASAMVDFLARRFRQHIVSSIDAAGYPAGRRPPRFQAALEMLLGERPRPPAASAFPQSPQLFFFPGLPEVDFVDPGLFPWRSALESCFPAMREEAQALLARNEGFAPYVTKVAHRPQADTHGLLENPDWSSFYLWANGKRVEEHAQRCPAIFNGLTDNVPLFDVAGRSPSAYLSWLKPGAHIPPHTGMFNCRYICHLPLIVPAGCALRVGARTEHWTEGKLLVFDDSVDHEAFNRGTEDRIILLFEVWNPHLSAEEILLIRTMLEAVDSYK